MAITIKVENLLVQSQIGDTFTVSGDFKVMNGTTLLGQKTLSVAGFRYESDDLLASIKEKFRPQVADLKKFIQFENQLKTALASLVTELEK